MKHTWDFEALFPCFSYGFAVFGKPPGSRESWVNPADVVISKLQIVHLTQGPMATPSGNGHLWSPDKQTLELVIHVYTLYEQAQNPSVFKVTPFMWKVMIRQLKHVSTT